MPLYLTENDVQSLLTMTEAIEALEGAFGRQALGETMNQPRDRLFMPHGTYHTMIAADLGLRVFGVKAYTSFKTRCRFLLMLYSTDTGDLLAVIEADRLGQLRTGAATGLATKLLARVQHRLRVGIYGAGWQAESQLQGVCAALDVSHITVYSRHSEGRLNFCTRMQDLLKIEALPAESPEEASKEQDVIITATTSREPVLKSDWIQPGTHINAAGGNMLNRTELDSHAITRCDLIVVDSIEQSKMESGEFLTPYQQGLLRWEQVVELAQVVGGKHPGRTDPRQITLFKSNGVALEDIAVGALVYNKALKAGSGSHLPMWLSS